MVRLAELIKEITPLKIMGDIGIEVESLCFDSREVKQKCVFFALTGTKTDGHAFISRAVEDGASAVVCEKIPTLPSKGVTYIQVEDAHYALGMMSSAFYGHPSRKLKLVGITGTNGKTTTATLLYRMFRAFGYGTGLFSTVEYLINDRSRPATHTTPDPVELNRSMAEMVAEGCQYCFMEVSSHSIVQNRIAGLHFTGAMFSNITHDHLDFHKTFAEYIKAKKRFFDTLPSGAFALVNKDDANGMVMVQNTKAMVRTYALRSPADFNAKILENHLEGMLISFDGTQAHTRFIGQFNAYNLLCVYASAVLLGMEKDRALSLLSTLVPVAGRLDTVRSASGILGIVDYAHTPDAVKNVLDTVMQFVPKEKIITVIGAGGNRDTSKRPLMAQLAYRHSGLVILTSDNPRTENPDDILSDMLSGLTTEEQSRVLVITNRAQAIRTAGVLAGPGTVILVAGKGHETYQEVNGIRHHFDDKEELNRILNLK